MDLSIGLQVRQTQSLAITPQLLQSIRLLLYDHAELCDFLRREGERNPFLVVSDRRSGSTVGGGRRDSAFPERGDPSAPSGCSLLDHARSEIADILTDESDRRIAEALLPELDDAGYLRVDPDALSAGADRRNAILSRLRSQAEPAGLFANDLEACLAEQMRRRGRLDAPTRALLARLDLVARRDVPALCRLTGLAPACVAAMLADLRRLDPRPGRRFESAATVAIEPDVLVCAAPGRRWRLSLNPRTLPRVLLDEDYAHVVEASCRDASERAFLAECRASAGWLVRALDQRARSILKVASEIVRRQDSFLREGTSSLRPMTLATVAEAVGLHESTVSRVIANKYLATPRGTVALKTLFTASLASVDGASDHSARSVRERIRQLVANEPAGAVLSDEHIVALLKAEGVEVARRTVAKYREALGIASSAQRRREQQLARLAS